MLYELLNEKGVLYAFEIESVYMPISQIIDTLKNSEGVSQIRKREMFSSEGEVHIRFKLNGVEYIVWEPYGDNSRYWVGPDKDLFDDKIIDLFNSFKFYKPSFVTTLVGDFISFNFKSLFARIFGKQP